jgi:hypothetical protein
MQRRSMPVRTLAFLVGTSSLLAACGEQPSAPVMEVAEPTFSAAANACAASPDFLATDEPNLRAALDGSASGAYPVYAFHNGADAQVEDLSFTGNRVRCGRGCMFVIGAQRTVITGNHFEAEYASTGLHLQGFTGADGELHPIDESRIERNTIVALQPIGHPLFGAIRPRDGRGLVVANNVVEGPWSNGIGVAEVQDSRVERNRVEAARQFGLFISSNPFQVISTSGSLFRANRLSGGTAPIFARRACGNVLTGNTLRSTAEWSVVFDATTGSNAFLGKGSEVLDNGTQDCDGDGATDPNVITGARRVGQGGSVGEIVREVLPTVAGHQIR